ncbi:MAG: ABC transporter permease [Cytophagales bacterium]|jgi:putative ABC transport system permease protein|nr:ABC transporter permease [Cytophagales bacterium]MCA6514732.1 ABC transporter permease [Chitinophagaceae bacterium]MCA6369656.1 ABC transporter permease [Cytophagales bacterium]MCA6369795.1 ABC transporter permease [Cytophagales bacterium]MCA6377422.1 ABC transporter permease [Cytophagales bacterium]
MKLTLLIRTAFAALAKNKFRTFLTMLGIVIGTSAIILMQAIGAGTSNDIKSKISELGSNIIIVSPSAVSEGGLNQGAGTGLTLKMKDVRALQQYALHLAKSSPLTSVPAQVKYGKENWNTSLFGVSEDYLTIRNITLTKGVNFTVQHIAASAKVCLIGKTVQAALFKNSDPLGKIIRTDKVPLRVIGTLGEKGQTGFGHDQDDIILIPYSCMQSRITGSEYLQQIFCSAQSEEAISVARAEIETVLRSKHGMANSEASDFTINTQSEITSTAKTITSTLSYLLGTMAGIAMLIGGIGIMNIMLVSVRERTREIGLRLAIGATTTDVRRQLLVEAVVITLSAGMFGVSIGVGAGYLIEYTLGWSIIISLSSILITFSITAGTGIFFGWYPATKAAGLNPIESLRYE